MVGPANEHHRVGLRVVWREALSPEGLTYGELFSNFLPVNLDEWPAGSGRYFSRMLHHLVPGPQTQSVPLMRFGSQKTCAIFRC
jgi:hypothetical protein